MISFWEYRCDFGHTWTRMRSDDELETLQDTICEFGHEAVTAHKSPALGYIDVCIRPAARISDPVTSRIAREHQFYIVIRDPSRGVEAMSEKLFTWLQAKMQLDQFQNLSWEKAMQKLKEIDRADSSAS